MPSKVASILSTFPEVFNPPQGGAITLCQNLDSYGRRSDAVDSVLQSLRREGLLTVLKGWRDEVRVRVLQYAVKLKTNYTNV